MIRGMDFYDQLRDLGLFSLEKRRFQEDLTDAFQYLKRAFENDGTNFLAGPVSQDNGFKHEKGSFRLDIRKTFFTVRVVGHWNSLSRQFVDVLPLESVQDQVGCGFE